jgi:hypothetical protein
MKYIKKFENHNINESVAAVSAAVLIGSGLVWLGGEIYKSAKKFWSKHVIAEKYKPTGKTETIITKLPQDISYSIPISKKERESGIVETLLTQYKDSFGNIYWGYDHLHTENEYADINEYMADLDMYTAMFREENYKELKSFLQNGERYSKKISSKLPTPVDMIFREDYNIQ